jgi:hypothetical protein
MKRRGPYAINTVRSTEVEQELQTLLQLARSGEIIGLAYVAQRSGRQPAVTGAVGLSRHDPASVTFWLKRLILELLRLKQA